MLAVRYILVFATPLLAAFLLFYGTTSLRLESLRLSAQFLADLSELKGDALAEFVLQHSESDAKRVSDLLQFLAICTILVAGGIAALFIRAEDSDARKLNLFTALAAGYGAAHLIVRFGFLEWREFGFWVLGGLAIAFGVSWYREKLGRNQGSSTEGQNES